MAAGWCGRSAAARPFGRGDGRVLAAGSVRAHGCRGWRRRGPTGPWSAARRVLCPPRMAAAIPPSSPGDRIWLMSGSASASSWARWLASLVRSLASSWRSRRGVGIDGERVVDHGLQRAEQLALIIHRVEQGLAVRVARQLGPDSRPHGRVLGGEVKTQLTAERAPAGPGRCMAGRGVQQLVQVAAQRVVDRDHQRPVGPVGELHSVRWLGHRWFSFAGSRTGPAGAR